MNRVNLSLMLIVYPTFILTGLCLAENECSLLIKQEKYQKAIGACKHSIKIKPDDADAHFRLGLAYSGSGMYKEAIEAFKQAIKVEPDSSMVHYSLGDAYSQLGMYKEAINAYKQAIRISPVDMSFFITNLVTLMVN